MSTNLRQRRAESEGASEKLSDVDFDDSKKVSFLIVKYSIRKRKKLICMHTHYSTSMERILHLVNVVLKVIMLPLVSF